MIAYSSPHNRFELNHSLSHWLYPSISLVSFSSLSRLFFSLSLSHTQLLEQNEDIIAAIVENLQVGRVADSIKHYSILHKNLVSLALALDNFPGGETRPYEEIKKFPDEIMRRDIMDELQHPEDLVLPTPPLVPSCAICVQQKVYLTIFNY